MDRIFGWIILLICCTSISHTTGQDDYGWTFGSDSIADYPDPVEIACQGHSISIRCVGNDVIKIVSASYGRQNSYTCSGSSSEEMENTECSLPGVKEILEKKCNNRTTCNVMVSDENFDDPCSGTRKYLTTSFKCVKFLFQCPGSLVGIGRENPSIVNVQPQSAVWTKDPLHDRNHVYFALSGQTVLEYETWDSFVNGQTIRRYTLPSNMARGNFIVYDKNLYYVKANSRNIVRYDLITRNRRKEATIPGARSSRNSLGGDISLAVDENGIWVTYSKSRNGIMAISKLNKDSLKIEQMWTTTRRISESLHTFVICGVVYSVGSKNGKVDYSYNTNLNQEKKDLDISFNASGRRYPGARRTLRYNATFLTYNPRDQLIYSWDASTATAVYYKLTFDGLDPKVSYVTTTTTTTTTSAISTTARTTSSTTNKPTPVTLSTSTTAPPVLDVNSCPAKRRERYNWPKTRAGETAQTSCDDGTEEYATWRCVRQPSMREAAWDVAGPDITKCITWATDLRHKYTTSELDRASVFDKLLSGLQLYGVTDKSLQFATALINLLLQDKTTPSKPEAKAMLSIMSKIDDELLKSTDPWDKFTQEKRTEIAKSLMEATEKVGFFYADLVTAEPWDARDHDPLTIQGDELLVQVEIRSKTPAHLTSQEATSFPQKEICGNKQTCRNDVIQIQDTEIMKQRDPATIVFALYQKLGDHLGQQNDEWTLDSRVISATFTQPNSKTKLSVPVTVVLQHKKQVRKPRRCVFWDPTQRNSKGEWSESGCRAISHNDTHTICQCNHLSSFALQVNEQGYSAQTLYDPVLDIVTKIGISIAVVCLLFCVLTFTCFRNLRIDRNVIHKHFCACLLLAELVFLIGINQTQEPVFCAVTAALLHYFFIATFAWISLESIQLYAELGDVSNRKFKWWNYLAAYGIPLIIVGISVGVGYDKYGTEQACWMEIESGLIWTLVGPIALLILINLLFLSMTVCKMYKNSMTFSDAGKINTVKAAVRGASVLLCLLGITWAFGILWLSEGNSILAYLFCVFNAFQGIFIFIFYCLLPKKVRREYTRCLGRLPCCQKLGRDYVSNSMSFSKQYTSGRYPPNGTNGGSQQASLNVDSQRQSQLRRLWNETVTPKTSQSTPIVNDATSNRAATEPRKRKVQSNSDASSPCRRNTISIADVNRNAASHRPTGHHVTQNSTETRQRQEDDVFLPPEIEKDNRSENIRLLQKPQGEIEYDRLQYYRCPEHYNSAAQRSYSPQGHYLPSMPLPRRPPTAINPQSQNIINQPNIPYHPRSPDMEMEPIHPQSNRQDPAHPYYWELDPPLAQQHHHVHQSSIEENVSSGKRDSGIGMQHLSPNSMMHRFTNDVQRRDMQRSRDSPISPTESQASSRHTPPVRIQEEALHHSQLHHHHPRYPQNQIRNAFSDDEGQGSSFEDQDNYSKNLSNSKTEIVTSRGTTQTPRGKSPTTKLEKPTPLMPNQRRVGGSLPSDSDDPIVTDCSGSSAASSFGRHYRSWSNQENMV